MRFRGTLKSWNDDRGFGFIAPTHGEAELFVHISALPRDGTRPTVGETLTYELGRGKDGRPQAMSVVRLAVGAKVGRSTTSQPQGRDRPPILPRILGLVLLLSLGAYGYSHYQKPVSVYAEQAQPLAAPARLNTTLPTESGTFRCDGRTYCSQMTSCAEATFFLKNCPGTKMDGDNDGEPCEQQLCAR